MSGLATNNAYVCGGGGEGHNGEWCVNQGEARPGHNIKIMLSGDGHCLLKW